MGYSLRVATATAVLGLALPVLAQDPERPPKQLNLPGIHECIEEPAPVPLPQPSPRDFYRDAMHAFGGMEITLEDYMPQAVPPAPQTPPLDDLRVGGAAVMPEYFIYLPFSDGTFDTADPFYHRELAILREETRRRITGPLRHWWQEKTRQRYVHAERSDRGVVSQRSIAPYATDEIGIEFSKVWQQWLWGGWHKIRVRLHDGHDSSVAYIRDHGTWRLIANVGYDDGDFFTAFSVRVNLAHRAAKGTMGYVPLPTPELVPIARASLR